MYKILIIDNEPDVCDMLERILNSKGYSVRTARDGKEGILQVIDFHPNLIFCDLNMPGIDGFETITILRSRKLISQCAFIFISGADHDENFRKCMNLGADDFLAKPFTSQDILHAVEMRRKIQEETMHSYTDIVPKHINPSRHFAHELNTPLNGIIGGSQLLLDYGTEFTTEETQEVLVDIHSSGQLLKLMIGKTLMHESLINTDVKMFTVKDSFISDAIDAPCIKAAEYADRSEDLILEVTNTKHQTNKEALMICMQELVENAFKFSKKGQKVKVQGHEEGDLYHITVSDHGHGMDSEQISKIGPYRQFDRDKHEQQGMGLGLAIVKRINKLIYSGLKVSSEPNMGTSVTLSI